VDDEADVAFADAHAEGHRGDNDLRMVPAEGLLGAAAGVESSSHPTIHDYLSFSAKSNFPRFS
jgi:hypothetical protein